MKLKDILNETSVDANGVNVIDGFDENWTSSIKTLTQELSKLAPHVKVSRGALWSDSGRTIGQNSFILYISLQPKEEWQNNIFHNSPYFILHFSANGTIETISTGVRGVSMRKTRVSSILEAGKKIAAFLVKAKQQYDSSNK